MLLDYERIRDLGEGTYGVVYLARHVDTGKLVAIKRLKFETDIRSAHREVENLKKIAHQNVVGFIESVVDGDSINIITEFISGFNLEKILYLHPTIEIWHLSVGETLAMLYDLLSGLVATHYADLIHRDLKPENICLSDEGRVVILDYGVGGSTGGGTERHTFAGTYQYMAPEMLEEDRPAQDWRMDIWSAGLIAYEVLNGIPFNSTKQHEIITMIKNHQYAPLSQADHVDAPLELKRMIDSMISHNPADRPSAVQLLNNPLFDRLRDGPDGTINSTRRQILTNLLNSRKQMLASILTQENPSQTGSLSSELPTVVVHPSGLSQNPHPTCISESPTVLLAPEPQLPSGFEKRTSEASQTLSEFRTARPIPESPMTLSSSTKPATFASVYSETAREATQEQLDSSSEMLTTIIDQMAAKSQSKNLQALKDMLSIVCGRRPKFAYRFIREILQEVERQAPIQP